MNTQLDTMIANMPEKTGKSLEEWIKILKAKAFDKHGEAVKFLKTARQVSHGFVNTMLALANQEDERRMNWLPNNTKRCLYPSTMRLSLIHLPTLT